MRVFDRYMDELSDAANSGIPQMVPLASETEKARRMIAPRNRGPRLHAKFRSECMESILSNQDYRQTFTRSVRSFLFEARLNCRDFEPEFPLLSYGLGL